MTAKILLQGSILVQDIPADVDLVAAIRELNEVDPGFPWMWSIDYDTLGITDPDGISFGVGVRGEIGALHWATNRGDSLVPLYGLNDEPVHYQLAGLHDSPMPVGSELPIDQVYEALSEFLTTRQLPTCLEWQPETGAKADQPL
jgi:Immunity protein Imm1